MIDRGAHVLAGLATATIGFAGTIGGWLLAQASSPNADIGPWVSGGSAATAVAGLVYAARLSWTGRIVARDVQAEAEKMRELVEASHAREEALIRAIEQSGERERSYYRLLHDRREGNR